MSTRKDVEAIVESHGMLGRGTYDEWSYLIDALATYVDRRVQLATREPGVRVALVRRIEVTAEVDGSSFRRVITKSAPTIVCLCGSTRFGDAFAKANLDETLAGKIVLTVGCMTHSDTQLGLDECSCLGGADEDPAGRCENCKTKAAFDELHKRKIDLCDEILVLNAMACTRCGRTVGLPGRPYDGPAGIQAGYACESLQHDWCNWQPYIGDSTKSEIEYAKKLGKKIRWLNFDGVEPKEEP